MDVWKAFAGNTVTHSMAHYLIAIQQGIVSRGYSRVSDVARSLHLSKGTVSTQIKTLRQKGLVSEDENRFLHLTGAGEAITRSVLQNNRIVEHFFTQILDVGSEQAQIDACKIEHLLSRETSLRLLAFVQFLQSGSPLSEGFMEEFAKYRFECPSLQKCPICQDECVSNG